MQSRQNKKHITETFPIVGIGASAGGFEAFTQLLQNLPAHTGMAFILLQHLDPTHSSSLTELLSKVSSMPIDEIKDNTRVKPDHIYVIPANADLTIEKGKLQLSPRMNIRGQHMVIDYFFRSLAQDQHNRAIGIILSGTGTDGTLGLAEIKSKGGITLVQDEASAKYSGMPHSAITNGNVDFVLPIARIAEELIKLGTHPYVTDNKLTKNTDLLLLEAKEMQEVFSLLKSVSGVDFTYYKHTTISRRIQRRLALHKLQRLKDYLAYLKTTPTEIGALYNDVLINVTNFFRDAGSFQFLTEKIFPRLIQNKTMQDPIRIWVPGCATGEEAYSLAIALTEFLESRRSKIAVQIFGTDVSESAIEKARAGIYIENIEIDVSVERLNRFFTHVNGQYQVNKEIRELCIFAKQNVISDPPFSRLDLISCRNVLIYLEPVLQKKVIRIFHYALEPEGYLMLGPSESVGDFDDKFTVENKKYKIYAKKPLVVHPQFSVFETTHRIDSQKTAKKAVVDEEVASIVNVQKEADRIILQKYAPVGVMVNNAMEIIQFRGHTSPYLEPSPGKASLNLMKMIREGLFVELQSAISKARTQGKPVSKKGLHVEQDGKSITVTIDVIPITSGKNREPVFLILFEKDPLQNVSDTAESSPSPKMPKRGQGTKGSQITQLKQELSATREYLQSTIEELESSNEELQVANEEILSNNEELQSTNEELETSKEELQSTNEELTTVNEELQNRNNEINQVNNDLNNLLISVTIPIIMLDKGLRIRRFTPGAEALMNLIPSDIGRPINTIKPNILISDLEELLLQVTRTDTRIEQEIQDTIGHWYLMRLLPYKVGTSIEGAVMLFVDIDAMKQIEQQMRYNTILIENIADAIIATDTEYRISSWNKGAEDLYGWKAEEIIGKYAHDILHTRFSDSDKEIDKKILFGKKYWKGEVRQVHKNGKVIYILASIAEVVDGKGKKIGTVAVNKNITELKHIESNLQFLSQASKMLASSLDYQLTLDNVARLAVPHIADWCTVDILDQKGELRQVAVAHKDPEKITWAKALRKTSPPDMNAKQGIPHILRTGKSEIYPLITDEMLTATAKDTKELELLRNIGFTSAIIVPIFLQNRPVGGISFVTTESRRRYSSTDLVMAEELGSQASFALENARLYKEAQEEIQKRMKMEKQKDDFVGIASHELKTPVTSLKAYAQVLIKRFTKNGDTASAIHLKKMEAQLDKLTSLIGDLLDVTKIEGGKLHFYTELFDFDTLVAEIVEELQRTTERHTIFKKGKVKKKVLGDRERTGQVLTNLLSNAIKYSPHADKINVKVSSDAIQVTVCIQDFGVGIPKENLHKIFERFYRVSGPKQETFPGLGLGLYVAAEIIKRQDGRIWAESVKGKGSTFCFSLPFKPVKKISNK